MRAAFQSRLRFVFPHVYMRRREKFGFRIRCRDPDVAHAGSGALVCRRTGKLACRRHQNYGVGYSAYKCCRLAKLDRISLVVVARRALEHANVVAVPVPRIDAREKHRNSAHGTPTLPNRGRVERIIIAWKLHSALLPLQTGAQLVSQPPTPVGRAARSGMR